MQTLVTLNVSKTMNITVARAQFNTYLIACVQNIHTQRKRR